MIRTLTTFILLVCGLFVQAATIYIDPTNTKSGQNGSISNPFDSWNDFTMVSGNTYLQKAGTTYVSSTQFYIQGKTQLNIGQYGKGPRPVFKYTGSGAAIRVEKSHYITISDFEVTGSPAAHSLFYAVGTSTENLLFIKIERCSLSNAHNQNNAGFGVYAWYCIDLKVHHCYVSNVAVDGFYCRNTPGIDIWHCNVFDINRRYFQNPDQKYSSGDGIQLDGYYNGFHIHSCIVQRNNGAGNKFGVIIASAPGVSDNASGIIERCTFITDASVTTAVHIERGNGIIVRDNTFLGTTQGLRLGGQYAKNTIVEANSFENCSRGVGVGATYPGGYPATGTIIRDNYFTNISQYCIWVDKATVIVIGNNYQDAGSAIPEYDYGGGNFVRK